MFLFIFLCTCNLLCCLWATDFLPWDNKGQTVPIQKKYIVNAPTAALSMLPWGTDFCEFACTLMYFTFSMYIGI